MSRGAGDARRRPKAGWDALTRDRAEGCRPPREGLSNPGIVACMFTSRRTVQFHVPNILAKLDSVIAGRLAALVARRGG